jgi:hypothetical protein
MPFSPAPLAREADLNVAIWSLWNYVMGATLTRASFDLSDDNRVTSRQRLEHLSERCPTIERSRLLLDDDWDRWPLSRTMNSCLPSVAVTASHSGSPA